MFAPFSGASLPSASPLVLPPPFAPPLVPLLPLLSLLSHLSSFPIIAISTFFEAGSTDQGDEGEVVEASVVVEAAFGGEHGVAGGVSRHLVHVNVLSLLGWLSWQDICDAGVSSQPLQLIERFGDLVGRGW